MKRLISLALLFVLAAAAAASAGPSIRKTPAAPTFTDAERQAELARRRAAVAAKMSEGSVMVLFSAEPKLYANDVDYVFRQENNLYYLTALKQAGITLVLHKDGGKVHEYLFVPPRSYFAETWEGRMYSADDARRLSGVANVISSGEQPKLLEALRTGSPFSAAGGINIPAAAELYLLLPATAADRIGQREFRREAEFQASMNGARSKITNARPIFDELRHIKSPYEIKLLQHAIDITTEAHMRSQAVAGRANWEYEVQAEVEYVFRRRNADFWGYPSIVGCGPNATTLHYVESQGRLTPGDLLLMDVGAEYDHYTADVTRTFPVNGKFSKEQAEIYRIVYDAQEAAARAAKPGATFQQMSDAAAGVIRDGLFRLGLITDKDSDQFRIWYMHGLGHWLGMNVHDVGRYSRPLEPGMVFTNEPGIYIRAEALDNLPNTPEMKAFAEKVRPAFEKYKNIGVRIEDDMLVTPAGVEWMSIALPRKLEDVEAFIAKASKEVPYTASAIRPGNVIPEFYTIGAGRDSSILKLFAAVPSGVSVRRGTISTNASAAVALHAAAHAHGE